MLTFALDNVGNVRAALLVFIVSNPEDAIVAATTTFTPAGTTMTALSDLSVPIKGVGLNITSYILVIAKTKEPLSSQMNGSVRMGQWDRMRSQYQI